MITGSMSRFPPPPTGDDIPKPVMWKSLGIIAQDATGYIEAHYALKSFRGDLDPDTEDEVRGACHGLLAALRGTGRPIDTDDVYVLQRRDGMLQARLSVGLWGEPTTVRGRM